MTVTVGDRIPSATMMRIGDNGPEPVKTDDLFAGKKVAIFGVPGAFTPTCSEKHLPGFVAHADAIKSKGVDTIVCTAVNDFFVMDAWGKDQGVGDKVMMVADGDATFTKATGLELDLTGKGLGLRCQRFAMIVDDGVIKSIETDAGALEKTSAEAILASL